MTTRRITLMSVGLLALVLICPRVHAQGDADEGWEWDLVPMYLWAMGMSGEMTVRGETQPVDMDFGDIFDDVDFAGTIHLEGRKPKVGFFVDASLITLAPETVLPTGATISSEVDITMLEAALYYRVAESKGTVDLIFGARYMELDATIDLPAVPLPEPPLPDTVSGKQDWTDLMAGARIVAPLSSKWDLVLRGDISAGGSDFTWNVATIFTWRARKLWGIAAGYRILDVDYEDGSGANLFRFDAQLAGPVGGVLLQW